MSEARIDIPSEPIERFCRKHRVRKLALFGSVLREDFGPNSDIDVLVSFEPGHRVGYFALGTMEQELTELLGRRVDLRTPADLNRLFLSRVIDEAEVRYERP